ncbi:PAS domain S-box protein [Rhizobium sp. WW_1]|jgi:PAS domain S-box-containing protein|uniref:sensor histidine kinase n=1 Tax=Rhizobium sp. WW_1 TaxID=1907375 RepID=UPI0009DD33ED|nr:PAS domain S-box protein [Rhizobium sp. WW_1]RKD68870.1 PAS domain S-box-containing protein [Rhizobium sp. WW_1]
MSAEHDHQTRESTLRKTLPPRGQAKNTLLGQLGSNAPSAQAFLAAIVESSDDAIVSKSINGIITSWNKSAGRLFGFTAEEAVGQHITIIIPEDRLHEEEAIIASIRAGNRIDHYETVRRRKDGTLVDISLTASPVRDAEGNIIGASKVARDISERKRAAERQELLLREMNHRIKNIFAVVGAVIGLSERTATSTKDLPNDLRARTNALAIAHELTLPDTDGTSVRSQATTLFTLVKARFAAHQNDGHERVAINGRDLPVRGAVLTSLALVLHEFATNAVKYGALSTQDGRIAIHVDRDDDLVLTWSEIGVPEVEPPEGPGGFGSQLERATVGSLHGSIEREWKHSGLSIVLRIPSRVLDDEKDPTSG